MSAIRIKVGASLDASALSVFVPLQKAAAQARATIEKELNKIPKAIAGGPYRTNARAAGAEIEKIGGAAKTTSTVIGEATKDSAKKFKALADSAKQMTPALATVAREAQRELAKIEKAGARAALGLSGGGSGGSGSFGRRVGYWSMRNFAPVTPTLSIAKRMGGEMLRGAGINTDASSYMQSYFQRQKIATDIANTGYLPGASGANGMRQSGSDILSQTSAVAKATALDPQDALKGLQDFVKLTGDLETGRAVLGDMAKLSRATGTDMTKMVEAAGAVSKNLGDVGTAFGTAKEKAAAVDEVMRSMAAQGKIGSVDISDLAKTMSKVAGAAGQIGGTTGADKVHNILMMGALTQEARGVGGAASAQEAANAAMGFVNTMKRPARAKAFKAAGINVYDAAGKIRGPEEIILEALSKTHGDNIKMGGLFANIAGAKAVTGFSNAYKDAYAGTNGSASAKDQAGQKAVKAEFSKLIGTMSKQDEEENFARSMEDASAKAQLFQNELQDIADKTMRELIPAMERLAPKAEELAQSFGNFISWATENPGKTIEVALAASIAKAGMEQVLRAGIEKAFANSTATSGLGGVMSIAAIAITTAMITDAYVSNLYDSKDKAAHAAADANTAGNKQVTKDERAGTITPEEVAKLQKEKAASAARADAERNAIKNPDGAEKFAFMARMIKEGPKEAFAGNQLNTDQHQLSLDAALAENKRVVALLEKVANGTIKVQMVGGTGPGAGGVDHSGRQPANSPAPR